MILGVSFLLTPRRGFSALGKTSKFHKHAWRRYNIKSLRRRNTSVRLVISAVTRHLLMRPRQLGGLLIRLADFKIRTGPLPGVHRSCNAYPERFFSNPLNMINSLDNTSSGQMRRRAASIHEAGTQIIYTVVQITGVAPSAADIDPFCFNRFRSLHQFSRLSTHTDIHRLISLESQTEPNSQH